MHSPENTHALKCLRETHWNVEDDVLGKVHNGADFADLICEHIGFNNYLTDQIDIWHALSAWWTRRGSAQDLDDLTVNLNDLTTEQRFALAARYT